MYGHMKPLVAIWALTLSIICNACAVGFGQSQTGSRQMGRVYSVAFSPDGKTLASAGFHTVKLWDVATGALKSSHRGHTGLIPVVAFSPDGRILASSGFDGTVRLWDAVSGQPGRTLTGHIGRVWPLTFFPDGKTLASGGDGGIVRLWDPGTGKPKASLAHGSHLQAIALSPDGKTLISAGYESQVKLWDVNTGRLKKTLPGYWILVRSVAFSPDGKTFALAGNDKEEKVQLRDVATGDLRATLRHRRFCDSVAFSSNSRTLASAGGESGIIRLWDVATGELERTLIGHTGQVWCVAFSPDGKTLASGGDDRTVKLWDMSTHSLKTTLPSRRLASKPVTRTRLAETAQQQPKYPAKGVAEQIVPGLPEPVRNLHSRGCALHAQGEYERARKCFEQALVMIQRLYPEEQYPLGHPYLASCRNNLGIVLSEQGEYIRARRCQEQALAIASRCYPREQFPQGHRMLAWILKSLGGTLSDQGENEQAREQYEQVLAMQRRLYPKEQYPQGHRDLARTLNALGSVHHAQGHYEQAEEYLEQALAMWQRLYPVERYPQGHPDLARSLNNLGIVLRTQGEFGRAKEFYERALAMRQRLYPEEKYPLGHPDLGRTLTSLGIVLAAQGDYVKARWYHERALAMRQKLYPQGHPSLAQSLKNLGLVLMKQREYDAAIDFLECAATARQELAASFFCGVSEAEALNFAARNLRTPNGLLSAWPHTDKPDGDLYAYVWMRRGIIHRHMALRQQALQEANTPGIRELYAQYVDTRRELARLTLAPAVSDPKRSAVRHQRLGELSEQKERLERELADTLPGFRQQLEQQRRPHTDLTKHLPKGSVFIDLLQYLYLQQDPNVPGRAGQRWTPSYVTFILRTGSPVVRVELGPARRIDEAVARWRSGIVTGSPTSAADDFRRLVWEPLEKIFADETKSVLLCPDGALTALPWAALPGRKENSVLLEEYAFAVVPYGQFLLERLTAEPATDSKQGVFLAVGDVSYYDKPTTVAQPALLASRAAIRGDGQLDWPFLDGTKPELDGLLRAAGNRRTLRLDGKKASTVRVLAELPKARWAHLATHGFFADPKFRSVLQLDEKAPEQRQFLTGERTTVAGRNPLVLSGLVLAGANLPRPKDDFGIPQGDGGILTAESIAGLPLQNLELAVLSACETGLGDVAGGEGVFGLQRAFHVAGAHTTVASLWKVDDEATRQLMTAFYNNMWQKGMGKLEALRQAQLSMLNAGGASALDRGPVGELRPRPPVDQGQRADPKLWAAWVLSGDPGTLTSSHVPAQPPIRSVVQPDGTPEPRADSTTEPSATKRTAVYLLASLLIAVLAIAAIWYRRRRTAARNR